MAVSPFCTVMLAGFSEITGLSTVSTVSVAASLVTLPPSFVTLQRYLVPFRLAVAFAVKVAVLLPS